jgi:hypothetical protein
MIEKNSTTARMIPTQINDCFLDTLEVVAVGVDYPTVGFEGRVLTISLGSGSEV